MRVDYFDYNLPEELIAQTPLEKRSDSRLMILNRKSGNIVHEKFYNIVNYLGKNKIEYYPYPDRQSEEDVQLSLEV